MVSWQRASGGIALAVAAATASAGEVGFEEPVDLAPGSGARGLVMADVDGDGSADVVVLHTDSVSVRLGDGAGSFAAARTIPIATNGRVIVARDLDGDTFPELLVGHLGSTFGEHTLTVLWNDGYGEFASAGFSFGKSLAGGLAVLDVDDDGDLDIAFGNGSGLSAALNDGHGDFRQLRLLAEPDLPYNWFRGPEAADLDGDGDLDLAYWSREVRVLWNEGDGVFVPASELALDGTFGPYVADVTGDGLADLLAIHPEISGAFGFNHFAFPARLYVHRNDGRGGFESLVPVELPSTAATERIRFADLDSDGDLDVILAGESDWFDVLVNDGAGVFSEQGRVPAPRTGKVLWFVEASHVDSDDRVDLVAAEFVSGQLAWLRNDPPPTVSSFDPAVLSFGEARTLTVTGTGFREGATIDLGDAVRVHSVRFESATRLVADVSVFRQVFDDVPFGRLPAYVVSPSGKCGAGTFELIAGLSPSIASVARDTFFPGDLARVTIRGTGFESAVRARLESIGDLPSVVRVDETELRAAFVVDGDTAPGAYALTLINAGGGQATLPDAFHVLPAPDLSVRFRKARIHDRDDAGRDSITLVAHLLFNEHASRDATLAGHQDVSVVVGWTDGPFTLAVPGDDPAWKTRGKKRIWKTPRGAEPRLRLVVDARRHRLSFTARRLDLPPLPGSVVRADFTVGPHTAHDLREWRTSKTSRFRIR